MFCVPHSKQRQVLEAAFVVKPVKFGLSSQQPHVHRSTRLNRTAAAAAAAANAAAAAAAAATATAT